MEHAYLPPCERLAILSGGFSILSGSLSDCGRQLALGYVVVDPNSQENALRASASPTNAPPARRSGAPAKWIVLAAALVVALVWFGRWFTSAQQAETGAQDQVKSVLHLEPFVVNLADPEEKAYLRVGIDLGMTGEMPKESAVAATALVRDTLLGVLTTCNPQQLLSAEGKVQLRQQLLQALQQRDPGLGVEEVYFTEFLIQR